MFTKKQIKKALKEDKQIFSLQYIDGYPSEVDVKGELADLVRFQANALAFTLANGKHVLKSFDECLDYFVGEVRKIYKANVDKAEGFNAVEI